jgi:L-lactate dehydrogenase complex protein LldG
MTTATATFEDRLAALGVGVTRTTPAEFEAALAEVVLEPAVGVSLPYEGVSLPRSVTTDPTPAELEAARTGVTAACMGIAAYGSVVLPSTPEGSEPISLFPERHVAVLHQDDLVPGMPEALDRLGPALREDRGSYIVATGPSATADMGALVTGAHGPKEVRVVLLTDGDESADAGSDDTAQADGGEEAR